jgi:hypothetical protein
MSVNIDGVCNVTCFEVIEIVDNDQPYPMLMGLEWAFNNQPIINLKKREMIFEVGEMKVIVPLNPKEGMRYIELVKGDEIDNLYNMIALMDDYVNLTIDGVFIWRSMSSCTSYSEGGLKNWQQKMHEVSTQ